MKKKIYGPVICGVYIIISPSGKVYIGESKNILKRWFKDYFGLSACKGQIQLYRSFLKYGIYNHTFQIIQECKFEDLKKCERFWQEFYQVVSPKGLNCKYTSTDEKKAVYSEESIKKNSISNTGKKRSKETRRKQSISGKGRVVTEETKKKLSLGISKSIIQYDLKGNFIKEWVSLTEASKALNIYTSSISNCILGKSKTCNGFIWKFKNK